MMEIFDQIKEQNPWWNGKENIREDVHLQKLTQSTYQWQPHILETFHLDRDVVYTMRGSRQVGKTTALKLLVRKLLKTTEERNIFYCTCNNVDDYHQLLNILQVYLDWSNDAKRRYLFIDEITFVKEWTRAIKHLADLGKLRYCTMILTGSNAHDLKYEVERMPGRRGEDPKLDKIFFPLSFPEYVQLAAPKLIEKFLTIPLAFQNYPFYKKELDNHLNAYLLTGGFIQAVNNYAKEQKIDIDVYHQYLSWVLGDLAKLGRNESYSRQIFQQVIQSISTNLGYETIAKKTSIDSHKTVGEYVDIMESNYILKVLYQVDINKKIVAPRKTKKIYFQDMFLFWVFWGYVMGVSDYFTFSRSKLNDSVTRSKLIENLVMSHLLKWEDSLHWGQRIFLFRTTNQAEVDFCIKTDQGGLFPIEVKYSSNIGPRDFVHLNKVNQKKGLIVAKDDFEIKGDRRILPIEVFLLLPKTEILSF